MTKTRLFLLLFVAAFLLASENRGEDTNLPPLVWAHYVGWGFPFVENYDNPNSTLIRLYDRPLLGDGWASSDSGATSTTRNEILSAMQYGIDGFTVDIPPSRAYASSMGRFYQAAEGLPFYVSLCVDGWNAGPVETIVAHLSDYFERWGKHPNNFYIDDKPVIFLYAVRGKSIDECAQIVSELKKKGHEAFWIIQPSGENSGWENAENLRKTLEVFDGFYDFGSNGVPPERMIQTFRNGRQALKRAGRPNGGVLVGGITQGYSGGLNAFYRPFFGTGTLRQNWDAVFTEPCDWVCITTWNDYWENTQFGPSDWGRDALLQINREHVLAWRKQSPPRRPPQTFVSYKNEVRLGDDWTLEILGFPYTTPESICHTRLLSFDGNVVRNFEPVALATEKQTLFVHRMPTLGLKEPRYLRLQAVVLAKEQEPKDTDWKELYPVVIRPGKMCDFQTIRIALTELILPTTPTLKVSQEKDQLVFRSAIEAWSWIGRAELLCNGRPIASRQVVAANKGPRTGFEFSVPKKVYRPRDLYAVRLTRLDGRYGWSTPVLIRNVKEVKEVPVTYFQRQGDFDECWMSKGNISPTVQTTTVSSDEIYGFSFALNDDPGQPCDLFGWNVAAVGGGQRGKADPDAVPKLVEQTDGNVNPAEGIPKRFLSFDGIDDRILLQVASFPMDAVEVSLKVRPRKMEKDMYVFFDQNNALNLGILSDGRVFAERLKTRLVSEQKIILNTWSRLESRYDGSTISLRINDGKPEQVACQITVCGINSIPVIGCRHLLHRQFFDHFDGNLAELRVKGL